MKRLTLVVGTLSVLAVPMLAHGQSLEDRIQYVMQQRAQQQAQNQSKAEMLGALLYTDLTVRFDDTPVRDAINYIADSLGITLIGRYSDDRVGRGIDPETGITLDVTNKPALTVLELVLEQAQTIDETAWQLRQGFVEVGTKERLGSRGAREIRYYPIRDLLFEPPMFDNAPDLNLDSALNQGGGAGGGGFGGGGGGGGGGLGGGGGGGGFGGGGGGGGGSGGGGGGIFDDPEDEPERATEEEKAQTLMELIREIVEPQKWFANGGEFTMRYYQGTLIINAPDYVHRQIGGYPFAIAPAQRRANQGALPQRRYVIFTGDTSHVQTVDFRRHGIVPNDELNGDRSQAENKKDAGSGQDDKSGDSDNK